MNRLIPFFLIAAFLQSPFVATCQEPDPKEVAQERRAAELEAPSLAEVLDLRPGMTVADIGAGFGAMTLVLANSHKSSQIIATDTGQRQLTFLRESIKREGLTNVTVVEGAVESANLPPACCEAIFLRLVYRHVVAVDSFNLSLKDALKPGGHLAIIDSVARPGSKLPPGVRANRGGRGIPAGVAIDEIKAACLNHVKTIEKWPPGEKAPGFLILFEKAK